VLRAATGGLSGLLHVGHHNQTELVSRGDSFTGARSLGVLSGGGGIGAFAVNMHAPAAPAHDNHVRMTIVHASFDGNYFGAAKQDLFASAYFARAMDASGVAGAFGSGNTLEALVVRSTGDGAIFDVNESFASAPGFPTAPVAGTGNRVVVLGSTTAYEATNTDLLPPPASYFGSPD
jgi:hypothetical protein